jgi:tetrahydromethanopterin S-methyltransferase subunit B
VLQHTQHPTREAISNRNSAAQVTRDSVLYEFVKIRESVERLETSVCSLEDRESIKLTHSTLDSMHNKLDDIAYSSATRLTSVISAISSITSSFSSLRDTVQHIVRLLGSFQRETRELLQRILRTNTQIYYFLLYCQNSISEAPTLLLKSNICFEDALGRTSQLPYQFFQHWQESILSLVILIVY